MVTKILIFGLYWSIFHPVSSDVHYMEKIIKLADLYGAGSAKEIFLSGIVAELANTMYENADVFRKIYAAEFAARAEWKMEKDVADYLVCGGFLDEWRVKRYMHGSGREYNRFGRR